MGGVLVLFLEEDAVELLQFQGLVLLGGVFQGEVVEFRGGCQEFLVEVQERLLEYLVFLCD